MSQDWNKLFGHEHPPALSKVTVLQTTWTDCPEDIQKIIETLWQVRELSNDHCIYKTSIKRLAGMLKDNFECEQWQEEEPSGWVTKKLDLQPLIDYLKAHNVTDETEEIWLHLWW